MGLVPPLFGFHTLMNSPQIAHLIVSLDIFSGPMLVQIFARSFEAVFLKKRLFVCIQVILALPRGIKPWHTSVCPVLVFIRKTGHTSN